MISAREAALKVLERCRRDGAWSGHVLEQMLDSGVLNSKDAALAAKLSLGVIQNSRFLDYYIDQTCTTAKLEPKIRDLLRLGAYQILLLDKIPVHAAVNESVSLCRELGLSRASGLVNAVLRRLGERRNDLPEIPGKGTASYLALRYSQSDWLTEILVEQQGYSFAEAFFAACQENTATDLQINTLNIERETFLSLLASRDIFFEEAPFPLNCVSLRGGKISALPGYDEGFFYVQDRAAAMAIDIADPAPESKVLDACAAPGGKSFAAAIRMKNRGSIISCDLHEKKLRLIDSGAKRLGITCIQTKAKDAGVFDPEWVDAFDLVIADVPCSGFGVMRKKPDIRNRRREEADKLPAIQQRILSNLASYVAPGGTLLYSTCTVLRQENEDVINQFLHTHREFCPHDFRVGERRSIDGCYTFWPQIDGTDGFFAAKLIREK